MDYPRVILIVIDACGVGALPDAATYGDSGASTLPHVAVATGGLRMPVCGSLGLGNIAPIQGVDPIPRALGAFGKLAEQSAGKDSTIGHWELAGLVIQHPFPVFPAGFPSGFVEELERRTGTVMIGNKPASGTDIIDELGERHLRTGEIILYTSADSVLQLAAHEEVCPLDRLHQICGTARELATGEFAVGRVIARPFVGEPGAFERTSGRRDFSLEPPGDTVIDMLARSGRKTLAVGKIMDLFAGRGFTDAVTAKDNDAVMDAIIDAVRIGRDYALIFGNCVDFDTTWGHRNDPEGFAVALESFDRRLGGLLPQLRESDILIVTADHGCDPTISTSTDHTREYVPLLVYGEQVRANVDLGTRTSFADVAATLAEIFDINGAIAGESFADTVRTSSPNSRQIED